VKQVNSFVSLLNYGSIFLISAETTCSVSLASFLRSRSI